MKKILTNIREFFWPLLEPEPKATREKKETQFSEPESIESNLEEKSEADLKILLSESQRAYEEEESRRKTIENKGSIFIAFNSVLVALLLNGLPWIMSSESDYLTCRGGAIFLLGITIIYFVRAIWFALKIFQRRQFHSITTKKIIKASELSDLSFLRNLISQYLSCTMKNYDTVNKQVDDMTMCHEYLKRGIVTLGLFFLYIGLSYLIKN
jgi:hypothetical protein